MGFLLETLGLAKRGGEEVPTAKREAPEPLEGTRMSLFNSQIPAFWGENGLSDQAWIPGDATLADRVSIANRCIQLNAQQISTMPLQFHGPPAVLEPLWVSSPDPNWYPNGIADAVFAIVEQVYGWGFSVQYITDYYADGRPRTWTVLDSSALTIERTEGGRRSYKIGEVPLDPRRCIQIDRNPGNRVKGTSALRAYAQTAWGMLAAGNQALTVQTGGTPKFYLAAQRRIDEDQATKIQDQWAEAATRRNGRPPVVPPEIKPTEMSFDPSDLALLETQEFNARALAAAFGVPCVLLNMALQGGLTYQNPAALGEMWWRFELRPTATRIVNAFSAQMLPRGQWTTFDAADTFAPIDSSSEEDDPQLSQVIKASPAQQPTPLTAVGGG